MDVFDPPSVDFFFCVVLFLLQLGPRSYGQQTFDDDDAFAAALPGAVCVQLIPPLGCELGTFPYLLKKLLIAGQLGAFAALVFVAVGFYFLIKSGCFFIYNAFLVLVVDG